MVYMTIEEAVCSKQMTLKMESDLENRKTRAYKNPKLRPVETPELVIARKADYETEKCETIRERFRELPSAQKDLKVYVDAQKSSSESILTPAQLEKKKKKEEAAMQRKVESAKKRGKSSEKSEKDKDRKSQERRSETEKDSSREKRF